MKSYSEELRQMVWVDTCSEGIRKVTARALATGLRDSSSTRIVLGR